MTGLKRDWLAPKRFAELNRWAGFYHSSVSFINLHARGGPTIGQTNHKPPHCRGHFDTQQSNSTLVSTIQEWHQEQKTNAMHHYSNSPSAAKRMK